ncbi:MAG: pilus assembly protein CpaF [Myxococcota bacterium]
MRGAQQGRLGSGSYAGASQGGDFERIKKDLHNELIESLDFDQVGNTPREELAQRLRATLTERVEARQLPLNRMERERLVEEILDNILGLGPLEPLLRDPEVSDIMINGAKTVFVERKGRIVKTNVVFNDDKHLMQVIERIVAAVGRRIDEQNPMVDARMQDGSRFNAIVPPLALDGPCVSIRRFGTIPITAEDLVALGSCPRPILEVLRGAVRSRLNIIISGGTGSGKTTLLNVLSSFIPEGERIITIEDSAELQLQQNHVVRLETRPPNIEGKGEVNQRDLVKNCLRMRPDRIILGEVRGAEAIDMLTAMNTGHDGSLATVHANNSRDALARFETMVGIGMPNMGDKSIRETIARALDLIIQQERLMDGSRRIMSVTEVTGMEGPVITTQDIFVFEQRTIDEHGKVRGAFRATGIRPRFASRLAANGIRLSPELFRFELEV